MTGRPIKEVYAREVLNTLQERHSEKITAHQLLELLRRSFPSNKDHAFRTATANQAIADMRSIAGVKFFPDSNRNPSYAWMPRLEKTVYDLELLINCKTLDELQGIVGEDIIRQLVSLQLVSVQLERSPNSPIKWNHNRIKAFLSLQLSIASTSYSV